MPIDQSKQIRQAIKDVERTVKEVKAISLETSNIGIRSEPPSGKYRVTNLWVNPATGKLTVEYDNSPV